MNKIVNLIAAVGIAATSFVGLASAEATPVSVTFTSGDAVVMQAGAIRSVGAGEILGNGDRIVTKSGATVILSSVECTLEVKELSTVVIDDTLCAGVDQSITESDEVAAAALAALGPAFFVSAAAIATVVVATIAVLSP
jgi:hypothetical protein